MDIRVGAYAVITDDAFDPHAPDIAHPDRRGGGSVRRVLLAHWNEHGRSGWTLPGGGLEFGEPPEDAARREVTEETGYTADLDALLGVDSMVIPAARRTVSTRGDLQALRVVYRAHITGGGLRNESGGSTDEAAWWPLTSIADLERVELVDIALRMAGLA